MAHKLDTTTYSATLTIEALHANVLNAYVMAPNREKIWTVLSPEFGKDADKSPMIVRALYNFKSAGVSFRAQLHNVFRNWGISLGVLILTYG